MRIAILQAGAADESLALAAAAGELLARGHTVRLFLEAQEKRFVQSIARFQPDLAIVQAALMSRVWIKHAVELLPAGTPSILVGTAATFDEEILEASDATAAVQGELDDSLPRAVEALLSKDGDPSAVPGFVYRDDAGRIHSTPWADGPPEFSDDRPLPHRDLYFDPYPFMGRFPWKRFQTGRGCVHSCGFCYLPGLRESYGGLKPNVRRKSVQRVIDEVLAVRRKWPVENIHFADDLFAPGKPWLEEFAERFPREAGIPFSCNTSSETVTESTAQLLAKAGCRVVGIGIESGVETNRMDQLGRPTRDNAIERAADRIKRHGMRLLTFNMIANPGETLEEALETLRFNQRLGTDYPRINLAYPLPGGWVEQASIERGLELPDPDSFARADYRAWCVEGDGKPFEILMRLFRMSTRLNVPMPVVQALTKVPSRSLFAPLWLYNAYVESRWSGVGPVDALRYARHAGGPLRRVTYHESIP